MRTEEPRAINLKDYRAPDYKVSEIALDFVLDPEVTRVTLYGGVCPCCAKKFKAPPPIGLEPGSPFGPNLRAFVHYLRYDHAVSFERLERLSNEVVALIDRVGKPGRAN